MTIQKQRNERLTQTIIKNLKRRHIEDIILLLLCLCTTVAAQDKHYHAEDSTDVFFRHLQLRPLPQKLTTRPSCRRVGR